MTHRRPAAARGLHAIPWLLFVASPLVVFPWGFIASGMMDPGGDDTYLYFPSLIYAARHLFGSGRLWTPDIFLGMPFLASPEFALLYPPKQILAILPPVTGFTVYILGHYVGAQASAYLFLRGLGASRAAATIAALAYGFSGFMVCHRGHAPILAAGAWTPLFLYFIHRARLRGGRLAYAGAAVSFAALPLAGIFQLTLYLGGMTLFYHAVLAWQARSLRPLWVAVLALAPAAFLGAIQVLPSMELAASLVMKERQSFAARFDSSFHPALFPAMALFRPFDTQPEYFARTPLPLVLAAIAGAIAYRRRHLPRAWIAVAVAALVLMMGRYVPLLPQIIHRIPLVSMFRIPPRHMFELDIALTALGAFGLDWLLWRRRLPGGLAAWMLGVVAFVAGGLWLALAYSRATDLERGVADYLATVEMKDALLPLGLALGWLLAARLTAGAGRRAAFVAITAGVVLFEARTAMVATIVFPGHWPDRRAELRRAEFRERPGERARILAPSLGRGLDSLSENLPLVLPGLQHLVGYASTAPRDIVSLLELDMHGGPELPHDLRWSRLPTIFGVRHIFMAPAICDPIAFTLDEEAARRRICGEGRGRAPFTATERSRGCRVDLHEVRRLYAIEVTTRERVSEVESPLRATLRGEREDGREILLELSFQPPVAGEGGAVHDAAVNLGDAPGSGTVDLATDGTRPLHATAIQVAAREPGPPRQVALLAADEPHDAVRARREGGLLLMAGEGPGKEAIAEAPVSWPPGPRGGWYTLEVEASAAGGAPALVAELTGVDEALAGRARMEIPPAALDGTFRVYRQSFTLGEAPDEAQLRVAVVRKGSVALRRVSLWRSAPRCRASPGGACPPLGDASVAILPEPVVLRPGDTEVEIPYRLPVRPIRVTLGPPREVTGGAREVAIQAGGPDDAAFIDRLTPLATFAHVERVSRVFAAPPDAAGIHVRVRLPDRGSVHLGPLDGSDACRARRYERVKAREGGLVLYRNPEALPRTYTVGRLLAAPRTLAATRWVLRDGDAFRPGETALVAGLAPPRRLVAGVVRRARFRQQDLTVEVEATGGPTFLVVNERYGPKWRATIDGRPARIYRTNGMVRGVLVPEGRHTVFMWYEAPATVLAGIALAFAAIPLLFLAVPWLDRRFLR